MLAQRSDGEAEVFGDHRGETDSSGRTRDIGHETREATAGQAVAVPVGAEAKSFVFLTLRLDERSAFGRTWEAVFGIGQHCVRGIAISGFRA